MEEEEGEETPMEALLKQHKKEKKELQSKIQGLKKSATKGDKKKKKEVQEEIAKLEQELSLKHEEEIKNLKESSEDNSVENSITQSIAAVDLSEEKPTFRVTKAQKRRDKKAAEMKERERRILEQEVVNKTGLRSVETEKIREELKRRGLMLFDIEADGNCLYNAIDHQLKALNNTNLGVRKLRLETSNHIRENSSDYLPFLSNATTGEMMSETDFNEYCNNIANTTNWGGQIELRALSHVVKKPITVIQADGPPLIMGEEYLNTSQSLIVSYHRHMYKLGEHYNSVQPYKEEDS